MLTPLPRGSQWPKVGPILIYCRPQRRQYLHIWGPEAINKYQYNSDIPNIAVVSDTSTLLQHDTDNHLDL